ncbi:MAG: class I SAM-dependent methyltransferase [Victivallales bacterium]|nr:class I SAM-dependent methyltransferase [Victivallales bacterium]
MEYDKWFDTNHNIYQSELNALNELLPTYKNGLEIGVGTGRFASQFGIKSGVEPSEKMAIISTKKGIDVYIAAAENLPFHNFSFDFVLVVTVLCFLDDALKAFSEIHRVLQKDGTLITSIIDRKSKSGSLYEKEKVNNKFFKHATFYSTSEVIQLLEKTGFKVLKINQTVFKPSLNSPLKQKLLYSKILH